jgi:predicted nucleotidyltransferase
VTEDEQLPRECIERLIRWAHRHERIARLYVFGSRAREDNSPDSDLDIAVLLSGDDQDEIDGCLICMADRWREEVRRLLPVTVDMQFTDPEEDERVWARCRSGWTAHLFKWNPEQGRTSAGEG